MLNPESNQKLFASILGGATLYGAAIVFTKVASLLLLPVFWRILTPADFGIIGIVQIVQGLLVPVFSLGMQDAVMRFFPDWSERYREQKVATVLLGVILWGGLLCIVLSACHSIFGVFFQSFPTYPYFMIATWSAYFLSLTLLPLTIYRIRGEVKRYAYCAAAMVATQSAFSLLAITVFSAGVQGFLLGALLSSSFWGIFLSLPVLRRGMAMVPVATIRELAAYSLPMLPSTILDSSNSFFDRYFLDKYVNLSTIGLYNISQQIGSGFNVFNQSLKSAWFPFVFRLVGERSDAPQLIAKFSVYYVALLLPVALAVTLLSKEVLDLLGGAMYAACYQFVPWVVLALYLQAVTAAMGRGLDLAKRSHYWPLISLVQVSVALLSLSMLVPQKGAVGAAQAVALTAGMRSVIQIGIAHYVYPRPFPVLKLLAIWSVALGGFTLGAGLEVQSLWLAALAKIAVILAVSLIIALVVVDRYYLLKLMRAVDPKRQSSG